MISEPMGAVIIEMRYAAKLNRRFDVLERHLIARKLEKHHRGIQCLACCRQFGVYNRLTRDFKSQANSRLDDV